MTLNEILASLLNEFQSANVTADINREHWQEIYSSSPLLREYTPCRVRVSDATVTMPLALDNLDEMQVNDYGIGLRQIAAVLPQELGEERTRIAEAVFEELLRNKRHYFLNPNLVRDVAGILSKSFREHLNEAQIGDVSKALRQVQQEFIARPSASRESRFIFRTSELEKIKPEKLFKFELRITVD